MSKMTYESFLRLHLKQLQDVQYKSGYEYAKQKIVESLKSVAIVDLFILLRSLREEGYSKRNYYAIGQAHAVMELIRARVDGDVSVATN